jgi:hypothetical protein
MKHAYGRRNISIQHRLASLNGKTLGRPVYRWEIIKMDLK